MREYKEYLDNLLKESKESVEVVDTVTFSHDKDNIYLGGAGFEDSQIKIADIVRDQNGIQIVYINENVKRDAELDKLTENILSSPEVENGEEAFGEVDLTLDIVDIDVSYEKDDQSSQPYASVYGFKVFWGGIDLTKTKGIINISRLKDKVSEQINSDLENRY